MRVLFYSPYIPKHFGGGEKHIFDIAVTVAKKHQVFIAIPHQLISREKDKNEIKKKYEDFLNYSLENITFISSSLQSGSIFEKLKETNNFDYVYYATDGSFFLSMAKKNNLHIQIPFTNSLNIWEKIKLSSWQIKNTNSEFTKQVVEKSWGTTIDFVHNPLVSFDEIKPQGKKEKIILHVGRFFRQLHSKRQDVLVDMFKKLLDQNSNLKDWKLVLVGSVEDEEYYSEVQKQAMGYPIELVKNVSRDDLIALYKKSAFYWHATGADIDEDKHPEKVEHFGITTIEAMAAGCVPVVINKGGQKEILGQDLKKLLWNTKEECIASTLELISNENDYKKQQQLSLERVKKFGKDVFEKKVWEMF